MPILALCQYYVFVKTPNWFLAKGNYSNLKYLSDHHCVLSVDLEIFNFMAKGTPSFVVIYRPLKVVVSQSLRNLFTNSFIKLYKPYWLEEQ